MYYKVMQYVFFPFQVSTAVSRNITNVSLKMRVSLCW